MATKPTSSIFAEREWTQQIPNKYRIPTAVITLNQQSIDFLLSDDTNPDLSAFHAASEVESMIDALGGAVFMKLAGRSPKDCSQLDRKITSLSSLVMLVKMSEYLTEALSEQTTESELILRKYAAHLEGGADEFRVYVVEGRLAGLCQKNPSFLGMTPTVNQLSAITQCKQQVEGALKGHLQESFVIDLYCSMNGKEVKILALEPFHIHALSLFEEHQLTKHGKQSPPLVRIVKAESELKDIDFSNYRVGTEFKDLNSVAEWVELIKQQETQQANQKNTSSDCL